MNINDLKTGRPSESGGHWYTRTGECCYEIKGANGKVRPVDLRDARKLGLCPGFSTIAKMEYKPQLEKWKIDQAYLAALTLPIRDGETLEEFKRRAYEDANKQSEAARDRGTHLHGALQGYYEGQPVAAQDAPFVWPVVTFLTKRFGEQNWIAEKSFAHPSGYGGKVDLHCEIAIVDFKFKWDLLENKRLAYEEHEMQLHAYEQGLGLKDAVKLNLFISSNVPNMIVEHEWRTNPDSLEAFHCLLRLWQLRKRYDSSFTRDELIMEYA